MKKQRGRVNTVRMVWVAIVSSLALVAIDQAEAQSIKGRIIDREVGSGIPLAFVRLETVRGVGVSQTLTDGNGGYALRIGSPGWHVLRIERLGYQTVSTDSFAVTEDVVREFKVNANPLVLPAVTASAKSSCSETSRLSRAEAVLWQEISKALTLTSWTAQNTTIEYLWQRRDRTLERSNRFPQDSSMRIFTDSARGSLFAAHAKDSLLDKGFIQKIFSDGPNGRRLWEYVYFGPDAELIMSPRFQETHCFKSVVNKDHPGLIGLSFAPNRKVWFPEIVGVIWVHEATHRLSHLEFSYDKSPLGAPKSAASGVVSFKELPNGMWVVNAWTITKPAMAGVRTVANLREQTNTILRARIDGRVLYDVTDSISHR